MQAHLTEFVNVLRLPAGRAAFALAKMLTILNASGVVTAHLKDRITDAQKTARETSHYDLRWMHARTQTSTARGNSVAVDRDIDQTIKAIVKRLEAESVGAENSPEVVAAKFLLEHLFPGGLKAITQQAFDLQLDANDTLLERLEVTHAAEVQLLNLHRPVHDLRVLNEQFRVELNRDNGRELEWDDVQAQRARLHQAIRTVVVAALYELHEPTPENLALLPAFFKPLQDQQEAMREAYRSKRRARDVNPASGEELDIDTGIDEESASETSESLQPSAV